MKTMATNASLRSDARHRGGLHILRLGRPFILMVAAVAFFGSAGSTALAADRYWAGTGTNNWATANAWSSTDGGTGNQTWATGDSAFFTNNTTNTQVRIISSVNINGGVTSNATTNGGWVTLYSTNTNAAFTGSGGFTGDFRLYTISNSVDVSFGHSGGFNGTLSLGLNSAGTAVDGPVVFENTGATSTATSILMNSGLARMSLHNAFAGNTMTIGSLSGNQSGAVISTSGATLGTRTLSVNQATNNSFAGLLTEAGPTTALALTKAGVGTLTLSQANSYTGATTISDGTLALSGTGSIASSTAIQIGPGAELDVTGLAASSYTVPGTGLTFDLPNTGAAGLLDATGKTLNLNSANVVFNFTTLSELVYVLANYDTLNGTFATAAPAGYAYDYGYNGGTAVALVPVPEPGAVVLLGAGLPTILWWAWRRRT
jgi:fibronectin-binding autotransporter adhesin